MKTTRITGEDRDPRAPQRPARDTVAQARAFEAALARGGVSKLSPQAAQAALATRTSQTTQTLQQRSSPLSGGPLSGRPGPWQAHGDRTARAAQDARADDADRQDLADDAVDRFGDAQPDADVDTDRDTAENAATHQAAAGDVDDAEDVHHDRHAGRSARKDDDAEADTGADYADSERGQAAALPANARRPADADSQSGGESGGEGHGDRDGMARYAQHAMLAALTSSRVPPHGGPSAVATLPCVDMRGLMSAPPLAQATGQGADAEADKAVLRSMLDAIDALRVDVDGRRGVEMDISVAGTQGVTVRIEEQEGCLQTTLSCRDAHDALRLRSGVRTLADRLASRFARDARVRIESPAVEGDPPASAVSDSSASLISDSTANSFSNNRAVSATTRFERESSDGAGARYVVAEAFAPAPGGEAV